MLSSNYTTSIHDRDISYSTVNFLVSYEKRPKIQPFQVSFYWTAIKNTIKICIITKINLISKMMFFFSFFLFCIDINLKKTTNLYGLPFSTTWKKNLAAWVFCFSKKEILQKINKVLKWVSYSCLIAPVCLTTPAWPVMPDQSYMTRKLIPGFP